MGHTGGAAGLSVIGEPHRTVLQNIGPHVVGGIVVLAAHFLDVGQGPLPLWRVGQTRPINRDFFSTNSPCPKAVGTRYSSILGLRNILSQLAVEHRGPHDRLHGDALRPVVYGQYLPLAVEPLQYSAWS